MSALEQVIHEEHKQTEVGIIPNDWSVESVKSICKEIFLGLTSKVDYVEHGGMPLIRATDIAAGVLNFNKVRTISLKQHKKLTQYRRAKKGDVLVSKSGSLGVCALVDVDREFSIYESIIVLQPTAKLDSIYLLSLLRAEETQFRMIGEKVGSGVAHLNIEMFRKLSIPLPSCKQEQIKIGQVINDVSALLTELETLIAKKQAIKTATMQQLLTGKTRLPQFAVYSKESAEVATYTEGAVEGASQGQPKHSSGTNVNVGACDDGSQSTAMDSRRKGTKPSELGEIPEDWDCLDFSDIFTCKQGIQVPVEKQSLIESTKTVRFIRIIDLTDQQEPPRYILNPGNKYLVKKSDLFMVRYGVPGLVGFNYEGVIANNLFRLLPKVNCSTSFYAHYLSYRHKDILDSSGSSTMPAISFSTLAKFKIKRPHSENEQTAIATILSDMDNEIQSLEQRLSKTRQIKQGMMQQLLTGRTRLPFKQAKEA